MLLIVKYDLQRAFAFRFSLRDFSLLLAFFFFLRNFQESNLHTSKIFFFFPNSLFTRTLDDDVSNVSVLLCVTTGP